ncbi:MarR family winged helix-turn-helix transcriptional regulator [Streptomyces cavernicola]|uniref:MarR family winged helix-turn-helix transcriptional regulator n=1 Tax=Streptomyces cavernicola TaxID=3043613 RepID=A0ABT6SND2_9ACTN|nr:MarR family winged helix-turn-helix transcriptional regulator [Streptomyces sp. B-S-A6]MDI3409192.1 MarR family winged helix-turn-helix transcriptional regulator [Streptomyces sp. B-S-A6]
MTAYSRAEALTVIQREMTAFARRARASAARTHPELSLVSFTLLAHLEDRQGCRATDLAAHYLLDKSTVSRQVGNLERLGYVERRTDPEDHRIQVLHLTPKGAEMLAQAAESRRRAFAARVEDWDEADLERFAEYLLRYNDTVTREDGTDA